MADLPRDFLAGLPALEEAYLATSDPIRQSGFGGGAERWRAEREPILAAVDRSGSFLDVGCANGYLLQCLVGWAAERGIALTPYGVDFGARLIGLARQRFRGREGHFFEGNAWSWAPPRRFDFVYTLCDVVPLSHLARYVDRALAEFVAPEGTLIVGAYGSRSRVTPPLDVAGFLAQAGHRVAGTAFGGSPALTAFAWIRKGAQ
jgi:SAM-dependent methyltransferase